MAYSMTVADPLDPESKLEVRYRAHRLPDQIDVGWIAPLVIEVDDISDLPPAARADILDQIHRRHLDA